MTTFIYQRGRTSFTATIRYNETAEAWCARNGFTLVRILSRLAAD